MEIISTVGKCDSERNKKIILSGADCLRVNVGRNLTDISECNNKLESLQRTMAEIGVKTKIMLDLPLPKAKIRFAKFKDRYIDIRENEERLLQYYKERQNGEINIPIANEYFCDYLEKEKKYIIGDGQGSFMVKEIINRNLARVYFEKPMRIKKMSSINCTSGIRIEDENIYREVKNTIDIFRPDMVAFSFVESGKDIDMCMEKLGIYNLKEEMLIAAKIENEQGLRNLLDILEKVDIIIVARGDLGVQMPIENLGIYQEYLINMTKEKHKKVVVATQVMDSLLVSESPSRADVIDVTNCVIKGIDGIVLSDVTVDVYRPERVVEMVRKIENACKRGVCI